MRWWPARGASTAHRRDGFTAEWSVSAACGLSQCTDSIHSGTQRKKAKVWQAGAFPFCVMLWGEGYVWVWICKGVHTVCTHAHRGQRTLGVLLCHCLCHSLETTSLTKLGMLFPAAPLLVTDKPQPPSCLCLPVLQLWTWRRLCLMFSGGGLIPIPHADTATVLPPGSPL